MSRIIKFLRTHPKKSIFFSALLAGGIHVGRQKYEDGEMMRQMCEEALAYGDLSRPLGEPEPHLTVLLNPAAMDSKARQQYERWCAPLLHLAGIKVATVRTEHQGQASDLMGVMANTGGVVVAGGDGTLAEVLTGLLRRQDREAAVSSLPLGVLPLGLTNSTTSSLWGFSGRPRPQHLAQATMAIVRGLKRPLDVMEITPLPLEGEEQRQPVFAASHLEWGALRDASSRRDTYWYWSFLKKYMTYVFSSYKDLSWDCSAELEYVVPCSGCSRCRGREKIAVSPQPPPQQAPSRWWMAYLPRKPAPPPPQQEKVDYSGIINEECGQVHRATLDAPSDLSIHSTNSPHCPHLPGHALALRTGEAGRGVLSFIREGWSREWSGTTSHSQQLLVGEVTVRPTADTTTKEGADRELNIDSEAFEVRPMRVKVVPEAVTVFAPAVNTPPPVLL